MSLGWPYDARTAAMQAEFVRLEEQFSQEWVVAMRQLAGERLPQEEFTARRMLLLKEDLKRRRREFAKLRWKFAPQWTAALGVDNIGNAHYWVYHPYAGRTWFGELRWEL